MEFSGPKASEPTQEKVALIVAHPGHELRVFHWMELHRPLFFCITDGSGGAAQARTASSLRLLDKVGATPGAIFGRYSDREFYRLLLDGRKEVFAEFACELAQALTATDVTAVAGDAAEGFNPTHDVCRFIIDGALEIVRHHTGRILQNQDFLLDAAPDAFTGHLPDGTTRLVLDSAAVERKVAAAMGYPELRDEVNAALARFGPQAFAVECLRPSATAGVLASFESEVPFYERFGEMRKSEGRYSEIIRYRQHVLPVFEAIREAAAKAQPSPV